jgi:nucleotide-binding universal stress UspA family protein
MFQTILVSISDSNTQTHIVQQAACLARNTQAKILVYHPFASTSLESSGNFVDPLDWSLKRTEAESAIKQIIKQLNDENIQAEGGVVENDSTEAFNAYARQNDASVIIIEKPDSSVNDRFYELMKTSTIPVLAIPRNHAEVPSAQCFKRILLPLDGSKRAECTLPFAVSISESLNCSVVLTHVIQPPSFTRSGSFNDEKITQLSEQVVETNRQNARDYLKQVVGRFSVPTYGHVIVNADVASSIHQLIEDESIDLVILSAHGTGGNPKWPYGNVANNLITYSLAPVLLIQDLPDSQTVEPTTALNQRSITLR